MKLLIRALVLVIITLLFPNELKSQDSSKVYINAGFITNIEKCELCEKTDSGGSIRFGILTAGKFGYFFGIAWFKEYHVDWIDYDDEGKFYFGGIDYQIFRKNNFKTYINIGLGIENFISKYANRTEKESSIKPDLGLLFDFKHINVYTGWQPSEPSHYIFGLGFSI